MLAVVFGATIQVSLLKSQCVTIQGRYPIQECSIYLDGTAIAKMGPKKLYRTQQFYQRLGATEHPQMVKILSITSNLVIMEPCVQFISEFRRITAEELNYSIPQLLDSLIAYALGFMDISFEFMASSILLCKNKGDFKLVKILPCIGTSKTLDEQITELVDQIESLLILQMGKESYKAEFSDFINFKFQLSTISYLEGMNNSMDIYISHVKQLGYKLIK